MPFSPRFSPRWLLLALLIFAAATLRADSDEMASVSVPPPEDGREFHFVRLAYPDSGFGRRQAWTTDMPEAEQHLIGGLRRLSRIDVSDDNRSITIRDDKLFDYPLLYAVEVGHWSLDDVEAARLRDYLLRGGTLVVDDFHGTAEWASFMRSMSKVFPDRTVVDIPEDDPLFHIVHDLDDRVQIPSIGVLFRPGGVTYEYDGYDPHWRGIYDDEDRLMVIINFNMDLGDAWEHADTPEYALQYTNLAYKYAVNYVIYAMTH
jgi:Domain of unknown function (DUF4159)